MESVPPWSTGISAGLWASRVNWPGGGWGRCTQSTEGGGARVRDAAGRQVTVAWKAQIKVVVIYLKRNWYPILCCRRTEHPVLLISTEEQSVGQSRRRILFLEETLHRCKQKWWDWVAWHQEVTWDHDPTRQWEGLTFDLTMSRSWCRRHPTTLLPHRSWSSNPVQPLQKGGRTRTRSGSSGSKRKTHIQEFSFKISLLQNESFLSMKSVSDRMTEENETHWICFTIKIYLGLLKESVFLSKCD